MPSKRVHSPIANASPLASPPRSRKSSPPLSASSGSRTARLQHQHQQSQQRKIITSADKKKQRKENRKKRCESPNTDLESASTTSGAAKSTVGNNTASDRSTPSTLEAAAATAPANDNVVAIPTEDQLMHSERLQAVADQLSHSLAILRTKLSLMEQRIARSAASENLHVVIVTAPTAAGDGKEKSGTAEFPGSPNWNGESNTNNANNTKKRVSLARTPSRGGRGGGGGPAVPLLPFQIRRAKLEREQLENEIEQTTQTIRKLLLMTQQVNSVMQFKEVVFSETEAELEKEIAALQLQKAENIDGIRDGFIERINLLHRYWPWRQLLDLGDTSVGATFEEELKRGPRYRHVGIQNSIESDYIETQLRWLEELSAREDTFRNHLRRLDALMEDLHDINDLLESTLTCQVCSLLFEDPVIIWPCGHSFCRVCFSSLTIAPSLFRCPVCGSIGSEGYVHNLLVGETAAKWMFKDTGYGDLHGPLNSIRVHLTRFRKDRTEERIADLRNLLTKHRTAEKSKNGRDFAKAVTVTYRAY